MAQCTAKSKQSGKQCKRPATPGAVVCSIHGSKSPQARAKAAERLAVAQAQAEVVRLGARRDIHPAEALLELVHWTAGEVDFWRAQVTLVAEEDPDALTWGVTRVKDGGDDRGTTSEAKPNVAYVMLERASDRLAAYAAAALKAGVDERRVQLAERQGALVADVIRGVLADLNLTPEQERLVGTVVPARLRALTATVDAS